MRIEQASLLETKPIAAIAAQTIESIYPKYYPLEVVQFFLNLHSQDAIQSDIAKGLVWTAKIDTVIIGTGTFQKNHISRLYILPQYQKKGYGGKIMDFFECEIARNFKSVCLDASLPACIFYENRGYQTVIHKALDLQNGAVLVYHIMQKNL